MASDRQGPFLRPQARGQQHDEKGGGAMETQETKGNNGTVVSVLILIAVIVLITFMFLLWRANNV